MRTDEFKSSTKRGFSFYYCKKIESGETRYLQMPSVSANKRGINDIGFAYEKGITLYATLSEKPFDESTIWQKINPFDEINKTVAYIKIENSSQKSATVNIRAILC